MISITPPAALRDVELRIRGSKSISNRHLILCHLYNIQPVIKNLSDSEDTELLLSALLNIKSAVPGTIDVRHAGTDMRFLTALLCITEGEWQITGSQRMKERPIGELINALRQLGAEITCLEREGYPPLKIRGKKLPGGHLEISAEISSQFISALLLIGANLEKGLTLDLRGEPVSRPYIDLTIQVLNHYGITVENKKGRIKVQPLKELNVPAVIEIESDWSSASYWFSLMALKRSGSMRISSLSEQSGQADSVLPAIYKQLGVNTEFKNGVCILTSSSSQTEFFNYDFSQCPDIALTVAVTCFGLGLACKLTGLKTLVIKESNRIEALCRELSKAGAKVTSDETSVSIAARDKELQVKNLVVDTYEDHRMAMSFAPLSLIIPGLIINNHGVVRKSYPAFWDDLKSLGFSVTSQPK